MAVYAQAIEQARTEDRVCRMPVDGSNVVHTSWSVDPSGSVAVWFWQVVDREIRFIDYHLGNSAALAELVAVVLGKRYNLGRHFLPTHCGQPDATGGTFLAILEAAGLAGPYVVLIPQRYSVWVGINQALELFSALAFRSPQCDAGLEALAAYRSIRNGAGASTTDEPVKDWPAAWLMLFA